MDTGTGSSNRIAKYAVLLLLRGCTGRQLVRMLWTKAPSLPRAGVCLFIDARLLLLAFTHHGQISVREPFHPKLVSQHLRPRFLLTSMRLLHRNDAGQFSLTKDLVGGNSIPPYAIPSHTWVKGEEVSFQGLADGAGESKRGYEKLHFCAEQAKRDGLQYFWMDTCCIDQSKPSEVSQAVNAMFRWYQKADRCYVYLADVSTPKRTATDRSSDCSWEHAFQTSRWFTRGWTLQELLAPTSVEFISREHKRLGDKISLKLWIHEITGIPQAALEGEPLSQFTVDERFLWAERCQKKLPEDKVYSLLGIFDVQVPLYYGKEGAEDAYRRLREVIDKREKCVQDLYVTNPRDDKKRIEDTKGGLLADSCCWIFENFEYKQWRNNESHTLLWIKGDPGKGKTMLLCGVINELEKSVAKSALPCYFFC
jgi:hypothetical protein